MPQKPTYEELEIEIKALKRDALEHQKTRDQLRRTEGPFRDLVEKLPIPVAIANSAMDTIYLNPVFTEVFGFTAEDIPNQQAWQEKFFKTPEYLNEIAQEINQWIISGAESTIFKRNYNDKWNRDHDVIVHIFHIKNRYYIFIEDITERKRSEEDFKRDYSVLEKRVAERTKDLTRTNLKLKREIEERKQAEEALRESEERYRILFEQTPDAIFLDNLADKTVDVNPAACKLMGYSRDELLKLTVADRQAPEVRGSKGRIVQSEMEKYSGTVFEGLNIHKDGTHIPVEIRTAPLTKEGLILSIVRDITARKLAQEERQKLDAQLQQVQKMEAISTLAGGLAHRFNNTLSVIAGNIELVKMEFPENEIINEYTEPMRQSVHHLSQLTCQMLAYARGGKYKARSISLSNFVRNTLPLLKHIVKPMIVVETDLPFDVKHVEADLTQMQMVLSALLQNASEAIEERGRIRLICSNEDIKLNYARNIPGLAPGSYVSLTIQDDGKGMDEKTKSRVFEPFFSTKFHGRGLGLAAVYGIVRNHNGYISIESRSGKGTTVKIYLPAKSEAQSSLVRESEIVNDNSAILLIEDEEQVLTVNRALLEKLGYQVIPAETGQKAIDIVQSYEGKIDLALLDVVLPDMGGKEIYPIIKEARPEIKVIVCSGYAIEGPVQEILNAGAQAFIQKPFSLKTLSEQLNAVIHQNEL